MSCSKIGFEKQRRQKKRRTTHRSKQPRHRATEKPPAVSHFSEKKEPLPALRQWPGLRQSVWCPLCVTYCVVCHVHGIPLWHTVACKADDARWSLPCVRTRLEERVGGLRHEDEVCTLPKKASSSETLAPVLLPAEPNAAADDPGSFLS